MPGRRDFRRRYQNNTIGSRTSAGGRNIISGNSAQGIAIADAGTNSNKVQGNIIGLNAAGTAAIANQFEGIAIFGTASSNTIGGTTAASPNIISGNIGSGISISGIGTKTEQGSTQLDRHKSHRHRCFP